MNPFKGLGLRARFFYGCTILIVLMIVSYPIPSIFYAAPGGIIVFSVIVLIDYLRVYHPAVKLEGQRHIAPVLSLGDANDIRVVINNQSPLKLWIEIIDELPEQLQERK